MNAYLFLLVIFLWSVPPFLESRSVISELPGFDGPLPFYLETGYVVVDEEIDSQLFYYFVKSERNPAEDPLLLWLTGGPGCSGFSGMVHEIGPITFQKMEYNGGLPTLILNPYSWTKVSSIIFLDYPIGTGFSFSRSLDGYIVGDIISSKQIYVFLMKWLEDHPEFRLQPFYVSGDSYSGKVVPVVAELISKGIEASMRPNINFKGYVVGNPVVGDSDFSGILMLYGFGFISRELYESLKDNCEGQNYENPTNVYCAQDINSIFNLISGISALQVLELACKDTTIIFENKDRKAIELHRLLEPISPPDYQCNCYTHYLSYMWANFEISRRALQVQEGTIGEWLRCRIPSSYDKIPSSVGFYSNLTNKGYRGLIYSGDHDIVVPHLATQQWIRSFNLPIVEEWRPWWVDGQVAGFTRMYSNNLTFATVKGGGHTASEYRPKECFSMIDRWLSQVPL